MNLLIAIVIVAALGIGAATITFGDSMGRRFAAIGIGVVTALTVMIMTVILILNVV